VNALLLILASIAAIGGLVCFVIILIDIFQDEIWKGILALLCGLYFLWYAVFDFEHEYKWPLVLGALGGGSIAGGILSLMR
jgi:hypothetical protein